MALNLEKTQLLSGGSDCKYPWLTIVGTTVSPVEAMQVLGMKFNRGLKSDPYIKSVTSAATTIAGMIMRLILHLSTDRALEVVRALLQGKIGDRAATVLFPNFGHDNPRLVLLTKLQATSMMLLGLLALAGLTPLLWQAFSLTQAYSRSTNEP